ncbi:MULTISPECIES: CshA/CshB family fibrillar adhesin-related protein [Niastella]|uniref:Gliding motility-associated C-terminal domain-containing protein n=1 Tax=Niastella soli TaxID=2821487 RepID=A0ABS3Z133_9BACT|nr:CshA/CshB family fibrillar adhesin-related protein [Niastella soli]MBO9203472.1 gliding motility-associated C-terminal domain-containing protein [Niastella soli]
MKKQLALLFLLSIHFYSYSQYANTGTGALRNDIWWFDWAGMNLSGTASRTVTTPDGLTITYTYSQPTKVPTASVMNTWSGAILHVLYNFTNPAIQPAISQSLNAGSSLEFKLDVQVTRNGVPVPFTLIAVDAEASSPDEYTTFSSNREPWQIVDFYRNSSQTSNPVSGCNTNKVILSQTYGNAAVSGQNPVMASATTTGDITINTKMDHQVTGGMAVAFGIMAPVDRGDLPASYGYVYHGLTYSILNGCNYLPPLPSAPKSQLLKLGSVSGDADGVQTLDDNASGVDEDALTTIPIYYNNGTYSLGVTLANTTGSDAYLTGWFDHNRNGIFDNGESVTVTVPNNSTGATLTWSGLPTWLAAGTVADYAVRLRLSSDLAATQSATGYAKDGEVEDHIIPAAALCNISIQTINDATICPGEPISLTTTGVNVTSFSWDVPAFLDDATIASPVATPTRNITYTVTGSNQQGGCLARDLVTLTMKPSPVITLNNDTTICIGTAVQLAASATGTVVSYAWSPITGLNNSAIPTPIAQPAVATTYVVKVTGGNGCVSEDSVKVTLHPPPNFVVNPVNAVICENDLLQLTASGGDDYTWLDAGNVTVGNTASITLQPATSQTYRVIIKENTCNNAATRSVPVTVHAIPVPIISKSGDVDCHIPTATLHVSGGSSYAWDALPEISDLNSSDPTVTPLQTTTYYVKVNNSLGCSARVGVTVNADKQKPVISINNDTTICIGTAVQLAASATGTVVSYAWSPLTGLNNSAIPTPIAQPAAATTYAVKVTGGNGCIGEDSVKVTLHPPPNFVVNPVNAIICENDLLQLTASGGDDYSWLDAGNTLVGNTASITLQPATSQTYRVIIKENTCNNSDTRSIPVVVNSLPITSMAKSNDIDCSTEQAVLRATGGIRYKWDAAPGITNTFSFSPVVTPTQTTTYLVTITNDKGCSVRDSITVMADFTKAIGTYPVPSAFTPNNDGRNDCFGLKSWKQVTQLQFQVFNRYGQKMFSTTDPMQCWDGTFNGELQPAGGYVYTIKAVTRCGSVNRSGMVMLIR